MDIEKTLAKHEGGRTNKAAKWVASGKNDVAKLQLSLEAHKSALEIALDMVTLTLTKEIKADTQEILNDTSAIKQDTAQILAEIARLQTQLPRDMDQRSSGFMLERYLDKLTSYAETVCDPFLDGSGGSRPTSRPGSSGEDAWVNQYPNATWQEYYEPVSGESSVSMMTLSKAGQFWIENDEEATHRNMQKYEYRPAVIEEPTDSDGTAHGISSANLEPRPDIEEPADDGILTSDNDEIYTKESVETEGMENLGFAHLKIGIDKSRSLDPLKITRATLFPSSSAECKTVTEEPYFKGTYQVRIPGKSRRRRVIIIDRQGYLTIAAFNPPLDAVAVNTIPFSSDDSPARERWLTFSMYARTERFHVSEFKLISSHGLVRTLLKKKIILDHIICGELLIMCATLGDYKSLLKALRHTQILDDFVGLANQPERPSLPVQPLDNN